jgi:lipopolysaccharide/colanic/teichoic acid biosynthesis glycosyltransferase
MATEVVWETVDASNTGVGIAEATDPEPHASKALLLSAGGAELSYDELTRPFHLGRPIRRAGNLSPTYLVAKRVTDLIGAVALLILLSPLLAVVWAVLFVTTRGRPLFRQARAGLCGREFYVYKFQTMVQDAERLQHLVKNEQDGPVFKNRHDPRVTRIGRILRVTSIDELPQLWNVLRGEMSLVGPRPLPEDLDEFEPRQLRRLSVKPGLTCLWQVSGRCDIPFDEWMRMDLWYVRRQGLFTDLWLLALTPWVVVTGRGAY